MEELTADFKDSLGADYRSPAVSPKSNEAPAVLQRGEYFYLMYGHTCCFCKEGAGAKVQWTNNPIGEWTDTQIELNPKDDGFMARDNKIKGQHSMIIRVAQANGETGYVFVSDLWSSAADDLKSHDLQFWQLLEFDDTVNPPTIKPLEWRDTCELDLATSSSVEMFT